MGPSRESIRIIFLKNLQKTVRVEARGLLPGKKISCWIPAAARYLNQNLIFYP
jgi:hypothetical protein